MTLETLLFYAACAVGLGTPVAAIYAAYRWTERRQKLREMRAAARLYEAQRVIHGSIYEEYDRARRNYEYYMRHGA